MKTSPWSNLCRVRVRVRVNCASQLQPQARNHTETASAYSTRTQSTQIQTQRSFNTTARRSIVPIPFVTENAGGQHHVTDLFSKLLKERIVCVYGEVDDAMAARVTASLLFLEADNPTAPISMYIDSPGGSVTSGLAIHDTMQYIGPEVSTIALGSAMSMGSLLLASGQRGKRYCLPNSSVMLHQPSGGYHGQTSKIRDLLNQIYLNNLTKEGLTIKDIENLLERDNFLSAKEALELGIVDEILASRKNIDKKDG